jgi:hypothetical protein
MYVRRKLAEPLLLPQENSVLLLSALFARTMSDLALRLQHGTGGEYYSHAFETILISIDVQQKLLAVNGLPAAAAA